MKVLSTEQIRTLDQRTIEEEPIASVDLMERAALRCFDWLWEFFDLNLDHYRFLILCGTGNNGGDGLVIARYLSDAGQSVTVCKLDGDLSPDAQTNHDRLPEEVQLFTMDTLDEQLGQHDILIDALFGTGLTRPLEGSYADLVQTINASDLPVVSIDLPSGLPGDPQVNWGEHIVIADHTLTFVAPKLTLLLPATGEFAGEWHLIDIGVDPSHLEACDSPYSMIASSVIVRVLPDRPKFAHKGSFGHAAIIGGASGMTGAPLISGLAALRSGCGLTTVCSSGDGMAQTAAHPELMFRSCGESYIETLPDTADFDSIGLGPGMGKDERTVSVLEEAFSMEIPLVLDADALNLIAAHDLMENVPAQSLLTPHPGEFKRLVGEWESDQELLSKAAQFASDHGIILVLKGAHTMVVDPNGKVFFNATGNSGMATAGSGDALTGILTGLLAQGMHPLDAALAGVCIHGLAGDIAAEVNGERSMTSMDIIHQIGNAFKELEN